MPEEALQNMNSFLKDMISRHCPPSHYFAMYGSPLVMNKACPRRVRLDEVSDIEVMRARTYLTDLTKTMAEKAVEDYYNRWLSALGASARRRRRDVVRECPLPSTVPMETVYEAAERGLSVCDWIRQKVSAPHPSWRSPILVARSRIPPTVITGLLKGLQRDSEVEVTFEDWKAMGTKKVGKTAFVQRFSE